MSGIALVGGMEALTIGVAEVWLCWFLSLVDCLEGEREIFGMGEERGLLRYHGGAAMKKTQ